MDLSKVKIAWTNNGEPVDGKVTATIDMGDGSGVQKFDGANMKEVADKLLEAQANATHRIQEFARTAQPEAGKPAKEFKRQPLDANTRFKVAQDITDPEKSPEAIKTVVESELGAPLEEVRNRLNQDEEERQATEIREAAEQFVAENPEYMVCRVNQTLFETYMSGELVTGVINGQVVQIRGRKMAPTRNNFQMAWNDLKPTGLVVLKTAAPATPPAEPAAPGGLPDVTVRERRVVSSTGVRRSDTSGGQGGPPRKQYTAAEIEAMPISVYKDKYHNEPGFREFVDSTSAKAPAAATR